MGKQDIDKYVGIQLKQRRTMMGLSQEAVAKAVGVTFQQVQKYEKGTNSMNAARLFEFSVFMNVPIGYFFETVEANNKLDNNLGGLSETPALNFEHDVDIDDGASDRESLEIMKSFNRIKEPVLRKKFADLLRAVSENQPLRQNL